EPDDLAGVGIERDGARREQIVARTEFRIEAREGVAGAVEYEVGGGIVGRGLPHAAAADAPSIMLVLPGLGAGRTRGRDGEGAPRKLAGVDIPGADPAAGAELSAGAFALQDQLLAALVFSVSGAAVKPCVLGEGVPVAGSVGAAASTSQATSPESR